MNGVGRFPNNLNARIQQNGHIPNGRNDDTQIHDLEEVDTISKHVQQNGIPNGRVMMNGAVPQANGHVPNGKAIGNGFLANGNAKLANLESQRREHIRNMYQGYHADNHI